MYKIKINKQKHNFSSAHFITFENDCESLHGHNYYVSLEIGGELDENSYLIDFRRIKKELSVICDELDHKVLIATENPNLDISETDNEYTIVYKESRYVFPVTDVLPLEIENTTVEKLSEYICIRLTDMLRHKGFLQKADWIEVGVEETEGQMASFRLKL